MAYKTTDELMARRAELVTSIEEIRDAGDARTDEQREAFEAHVAEVKGIDAEVELRNTAATAAKAPEVIAHDGTPTTPVLGARDLNPYEGELRLMSKDELRGRALKAVDEHPVADEHKAALVHHLERNDDDLGSIARRVVATSSPDYTSAFAKYMRGEQHLWSDAERRAVARAASIGTTTAGGFGVPSPIDPTLILTGDLSANPIRQIATVKTGTVDQWLGLSVGAASASWDGEAGEASDDTPTWAQPSIDAEKAQIFIPASIEVTQDYPGFADDVALVFAEAKDTLEGAAFTTGAGSGSNQPTGVITAVAAVTASRVAATTNNAFGLVDVYATFEGLPVRHRRNASWGANLSIINDIRQFGTANNYHGFTVDLTAAGIPQVLGKPMYEFSDMDGSITTGDDDVLIVGNFKRYVVYDRVGFNIEYIPHLFATGNNRPSGQRGYYGYWRVGGGVVDTNAFRLLRV